MGVMERRKRRAFTKEFKAETVRLVVEGKRSSAEVARDLDLTESALRAWVRQAEVDAGRGKPVGAGRLLFHRWRPAAIGPDALP